MLGSVYIDVPEYYSIWLYCRNIRSFWTRRKTVQFHREYSV